MQEQDYRSLMLGNNNREPEPIDYIRLSPNGKYNTIMKSGIPNEIKVISSLESLDKLVNNPSDVFSSKDIVDLIKYMKDDPTVKDSVDIDNPTVKDRIELEIAREYWKNELNKKDYTDEDIKRYAKGSVDSIRETNIYKAFKSAIINKKVRNIDLKGIIKPILDYLSREDVNIGNKVNFVSELENGINAYLQHQR